MTNSDGNYWTETEKRLRDRLLKIQQSGYWCEDRIKFEAKLDQFFADKAQHEKEMNNIRKLVHEEADISHVFLADENDLLQKEISDLKKENERIDAQNFLLCEMNVELELKIEELEKWIETHKFANEWGCEIMLYTQLKEKLKEMFE